MATKKKVSSTKETQEKLCEKACEMEKNFQKGECYGQTVEFSCEKRHAKS